MKQQYIVLKQENDSLLDLIGLSWNTRSRIEAYKLLRDIHRKAEVPGMAKAIVTCLGPGKEILGIGGSSLLQEKKTGKIISDVINNNFGNWWAGNIHALSGALFSRSGFLDIGAVARTIGMSNTTFAHNDQLFNCQENVAASFPVGSEVQIGQGVTAPARADTNIQTPFANGGLEDNRVNTGLGGYNSALGTVEASGNINQTTGSGTVIEACYFQSWLTVGTVQVYLISRDLITPTVDFPALANISIDYTWQM